MSKFNKLYESLMSEKTTGKIDNPLKFQNVISRVISKTEEGAYLLRSVDREDRAKAFDKASKDLQYDFDETLDLKTATDVYDDLKSRFPDWTVRLIHGRLKKDERQHIMSEFKRGAIHILVATTVIEVGIDVPNASVMLIEHAERFGLAQLHQLRGRVGRGEHDSECLLVTYPPLSEDGKARIDAMLQSDDGFVIAEEDLKIRAQQHDKNPKHNND